MQTYTVYEKRVAPEDLEERAASLIFVKEGFAVWALVFPALWFLFHRLWRGLFLYIFLSVGLTVLLMQLNAGEQAIAWGGFLLNIIFAFEARDIYRASLERRGYVMKGVVSGRNLEECERRYLMEWLPEARRERDRNIATAPGASAGTGSAPAGGAPSSGVPVIGMFPAHGG